MSNKRLVMVFLAVLSGALLSACAEPTRVTPGPSAYEIPREQPLALEPHLELWRPLLERLRADGFDAAQVAAVAEILARPGVYYDPAPMRDKLETLYRLLFAARVTREIQQGLDALGYDPGPADGMAGARTRAAIREFQRLHGLEQDGEPTEPLLAAVNQDLALPADARPVPEVAAKGEDAPRYHESVLRADVVAKAREFLSANRSLLEGVERDYGVPPEIVTAILTVETRLGENTGCNRAFTVLAGMALSRDLTVIEPYLWQSSFTEEERAFLAEKAAERGDWAYDEFKALLRHAWHEGRDPLSFPSSIYGAVGMCQFMPSNVLVYGVDGDRDGDVDLFSVEDAVFSVGRYFQGHGWRKGLDLEAQREVVHAYNHSTIYVNTIMELASRLR